MHGIFQRARRSGRCRRIPVADVEKPPLSAAGTFRCSRPRRSGAVRAAASEQDAALFLTAAFTGLRMGEPLALRWRDVDFAGSSVRVRASYSAGHLTTPKSGKVRAVPLAPDVASALAAARPSRKLGRRRRPGVRRGDGLYLDGSALRRRYKAALDAAGLRPLRFHDLRHTFGTRMIAKADIRRVQEWMGHADIQTTMRYLHFAPRDEDAALVAEAFATVPPAGEPVRCATMKMPPFAGRSPTDVRRRPWMSRAAGRWLGHAALGADRQRRRALPAAGVVSGPLQHGKRAERMSGEWRGNEGHEGAPNATCDDRCGDRDPPCRVRNLPGARPARRGRLPGIATATHGVR